MRPTLAVSAFAFALSATLAPAGQARADDNDLREFRVGMAVKELPRSGYERLTCADSSGRKLRGWEDYRQCPPQASGLRAVSFRYDDKATSLARVNDTYEGTKVQGHPVRLALLIDDTDRVGGLVIETDPSARLFLRKKAFLFGEQVKARYGEEGWACTNQDLASDEQSVGGVSIKEHCEKRTATRHFVLDRVLLRRSGQELKDFVSRSRLEILGAE